MAASNAIKRDCNSHGPSSSGTFHILLSLTGVAHTLDHAVGLLGVLAKAIDI